MTQFMYRYHDQVHHPYPTGRWILDEHDCMEVEVTHFGVPIWIWDYDFVEVHNNGGS